MAASTEITSRTDIMLAAAKMYVERKRNWQTLFSYGEQIASENQLSEADILNEIKTYRRE